MKKKYYKVLNTRLNKRSFAHGLNFYKLFWIFFIGSFLGVVVETLWCLIVQHKFEIRWGLIYGPFNPIYGFGALILTVCLSKISFLKDRWIFLICTVVGASFEYLCSLFQEFVFKTSSWDYSEVDYNFGGRTSILFAIFWGILGIIWLKIIYPKLYNIIEKISSKFGRILTWLLFIYMILNMSISALAVWRQSQRELGVESNSLISEFLDQNYNDDFLKIMYPNMLIVK